MGVSVLRVAACAGLLVGVLLLGDSAAGTAVADPGGAGHRHSDEQSSKAVNNEHRTLSHIIRRIFSEHRKWADSSPRSAPQAKIGSAPDSSFIASESNEATTFADADDATDPEGTQPGTDGTEPAGVDLVTNAEAAGGSEYTDRVVVIDNAAVAAEPEPAPPRQQVIEYPFLYYLLEVRRGGRGWWNATIIISRRQKVVSQPTPEPEPEVVPRPAFRGPAPEAPAPEPILDASGGVAGGSDYQSTDFGGAPVVVGARRRGAGGAPGRCAVPVVPARGDVCAGCRHGRCPWHERRRRADGGRRPHGRPAATSPRRHRQGDVGTGAATGIYRLPAPPGPSPAGRRGTTRRRGHFADDPRRWSHRLPPGQRGPDDPGRRRRAVSAVGRRSKSARRASR